MWLRQYAHWHSVYGTRFGHASMRIDTWCGYASVRIGTRFGHASVRIDNWCGYASMRIGNRFMALALDTPVCALTLGVATPVCALAIGLWRSLWTCQYVH